MQSSQIWAPAGFAALIPLVNATQYSLPSDSFRKLTLTVVSGKPKSLSASCGDHFVTRCIGLELQESRAIPQRGQSEPSLEKINVKSTRLRQGWGVHLTSDKELP